MSNDRTQKEQLLALVRDAVEKDGALRKEYQIGEKFRFIRDRLNALRLRIEENIITNKKVKKIVGADKLADDEVYVYVYLFNAQGLNLQSWYKMLNSEVFYDHSINRPIYKEKSHVEAFIRSKQDKAQHSYLIIGIKKIDILPEEVKDSIGHPVIKVREGSLQTNRLFAFVHDRDEYTLDEEGILIKK